MLALLVVAGVLAGLTGTVAGLASLVSYPALLLFGLSPLSANMTNTAAMGSVLLGSLGGARQELRGQGRRLLLLSACAALGGAGGAALLLGLPDGSFEAVVPVLVAAGSLLLLLREPVRRWSEARRGAGERARRRWPFVLALTVVGIYAGYFGAASGIILLAVLSVRYAEPFAVTNAVKTIVSGAANIVATVVYAVVGDVDWSAALALGVGMFVGGWLGPAVVRRLPERPLRIGIALAGFGLAAWLAAS